ncbi:MAG TPA: amino acid permease [Pirellulales bacterium]
MHSENRLHRVLGPIGLTSLGVGAIIGTGIFVLVGKAAHDTTGPALMLSFVVAGLACIFAALCYAEFSSMVPVSGSAYTYAYATLGEMFAWIIGWDLVLEYSVAAATVAHGWSKYFQDFIKLFDWKVPPLLADSPYRFALVKETINGVETEVHKFVPTGALFDLPALLISLAVTVVLVIGIRQTAWFNSSMVVVKVGIVLFVIAVGSFYVDPENWTPFAPFGYGGMTFFGWDPWAGPEPRPANAPPVGMLAGASMIFFAYIGFDSISTHSEEAKNPQRDLPIGIIASLIICTLLYIAMAAVLTGMVPYDKINVDAPVSNAFEQIGLTTARYIISFGALCGITSVLLVMMLSQPRVLLAMARDGLIPPDFFGAVHPVFRTPHRATILTGVFVAAMSSLLPLEVLADLVNIGTLLAFVIVCAAVLIMRRTNPEAPRPFKVPLVPLIPILGIVFCLALMFALPWYNWVRLAVWLGIGFVIYFGYGMRNSNVSNWKPGQNPPAAPVAE